MVASGKYGRLHYNQKMSTITGDPKTGGQQPDVAGVTHEGSVDTVEVGSKSQTVAKLDEKGVAMQAKLQPSMRGEHRTVTVEEGLAGKGVPRGGSMLGVAGAGAGLLGALIARHENPSMSTAEFMARAFGVYEIAVAAGDLPPPTTYY